MNSECSCPNFFKTKANLNYVKNTQSVPRSKHSPSRL